MIGMMFYLLKMVLLDSNVKITRLLPHQATKSLDTAHLAFQNENFQKQPLKLSPYEHTTIPKLVGTWISPWLFIIIQETSKIQLVYNQKNNNLQKWFNVATWKITGFQCQYCFPGWAAGAAALNKSMDFLMKYFRWNMLKHLKGYEYIDSVHSSKGNSKASLGHDHQMWDVPAHLPCNQFSMSIETNANQSKV